MEATHPPRLGWREADTCGRMQPQITLSSGSGGGGNQSAESAVSCPDSDSQSHATVGRGGGVIFSPHLVPTAARTSYSIFFFFSILTLEKITRKLSPNIKEKIEYETNLQSHW